MTLGGIEGQAARFDQIKTAFWGEGTYGVLPPLASAMVTEAEQVLGVRLPLELVELLRVQNGGSVSETCNTFLTSVPTSWADDHVVLGSVNGIGSPARALYP
jgi:hypothetical protein